MRLNIPDTDTDNFQEGYAMQHREVDFLGTNVHERVDKEVKAHRA